MTVVAGLMAWTQNRRDIVTDVWVDKRRPADPLSRNGRSIGAGCACARADDDVKDQPGEARPVSICDAHHVPRNSPMRTAHRPRRASITLYEEERVTGLFRRRLSICDARSGRSR